MPGTYEFAELAYTLSDLLVARYNVVADTYDNPIALAGGQMLEVDPQGDQDDLREYGQITRGLSIITHAKIKLSAGGIDFDALAAITGMTNQTSGSTPNRVRTTDVASGGAGMPYWGVIGVAETDDVPSGKCVVGLRKCKLNTFPKWALDGKENKFFIGDTEGRAFALSSRIERVKTYETGTVWVAPTTGTTFKEFFTLPA